VTGRPPPCSDQELYRRGAETLLASWEAYAQGSPGATVHREDGVAIALFPHPPERILYNNAVLERGMGPARRARAVQAMAAAYQAAGIDRYAAWVHETDEPLRAELTGRGYTVDDATRAMGLSLADVSPPAVRVELGVPDWDEHLRIIGAPAGLLAAADRRALHVVVGRLAGEDVTTALAFDHAGDCGIYNVATLEGARRRGLATALTAHCLREGVRRGCSTASLQASPMAEGVYAAVGFRDLGRFLEYVPAA
jgi:ribosomal protein S18 acetylase RimI-like enzyme